MFDFPFAKTNRIPAALDVPKAGGLDPAPAPDTQPAQEPPPPSAEAYQRLINGETAAAPNSEIDRFLVDTDPAGGPSVNSFRPIHVPDLWTDIYSQFPKHGSKETEIPYRSIILKYDALVRTFKAMRSDMYRLLKGGKLNPAESKAVYQRMKQLDGAATQAEQFKKQAEFDFSNSNPTQQV